MVFIDITNDIDVINFIRQNNKYKQHVKIACQQHGKCKNKLYPELGNYKFISENQKKNFLQKTQLLKIYKIYIEINIYRKISFNIGDKIITNVNKLLYDAKKYKKICSYSVYDVFNNNNTDTNIDTKSDISDTELCIQNNLHKPENKLTDSKNTKLFKVTKSKTVITKYYNV
jgi:hypothetical protein